MPANLTPMYLQAEEEFRQAITTEEKIEALRRMIALLPKHKGTDHLFADLKRRLAKLQKEEHARGRGRRVDPFHIPKEGAGQVVLLGFPNVGKSSLLRALTAAEPPIAEYPFTTQLPQPGMMEFEDIQVQLVDTPAMTGEITPGGLVTRVRLTDLALLVVDLSSDDVLSHVEDIVQRLAVSKVDLVDTPLENPEAFYVQVKTLIVANKKDIDGAADRLEVLQEFYGQRFPMRSVSALRREGLEDLRREIVQRLGIIRVYTKIPGRPPDLEKPFTLPEGSTVTDLARAVHKDFAAGLKYARIWGSEKYDGQTVSRDHVLEDKDVIELHM